MGVFEIAQSIYDFEFIIDLNLELHVHLAEPKLSIDHKILRNHI